MSPGASKLARPSLSSFSDRLVRERVEATRQGVALDVPIPHFGIESEKPLTQREEILA